MSSCRECRGWPEYLISNNYTELLAALYCLEALPDGWGGTLYTDSLVTLRRVARETHKKTWNGIPDTLIGRALDVSARLGAYKVELLGGHPTGEDLVRGFRGHLGGPPVSRWNVFCDERCKAMAEKFRREKIEARYASPVARPDDNPDP